MAESSAAAVKAYFLGQAAAVTIWWGLPWAWPPFRGLFATGDAPGEVLASFALADAVCLVAGSIVAGLLADRGHRAASSAAWAVFGATGYSTLLCATMAARGDLRWLSVALMGALTVACAFAASKSGR